MLWCDSTARAWLYTIMIQDRTRTLFFEFREREIIGSLQTNQVEFISSYIFCRLFFVRLRKTDETSEDFKQILFARSTNKLYTHTHNESIDDDDDKTFSHMERTWSVVWSIGNIKTNAIHVYREKRSTKSILAHHLFYYSNK